MNRKKVLSRITALLAVFGVAFALFPFFQSLKPSARADAEIPRIDISALKERQFVIVDIQDFYPKSRNLYTKRVMLYRNSSGEIRAWGIYVKDGLFVMPDVHWWRTMYLCKNFGPYLNDGYVDESKPIECHDKALPLEGWRFLWQWDLSGKNISTKSDDLEPFEGEEIGNYYYLVKRA